MAIGCPQANPMRRAMARLGPHLINVHVLANLEPFRYGATEFIRKSMLAARDRPVRVLRGCGRRCGDGDQVGARAH